MTVLAQFLLIFPQFSRVRFEVLPYHTYDLAGRYPETLFDQRMNEIQTTTQSLYPAAVSDYLVLSLVTVGSLFGFFAVSDFLKYVIICIIVPCIIWIWVIRQKRRFSAQVDKFKTTINALLETYTTSDFATYSISWLLLSKAGPDDETSFPTGVIPCHYIHIIFHNPDSVPEDPLPLYLPHNENEKPPDYGLPDYELRAIKVDESVDLAEATHAPVEGLCAEDVQRVLTHAPGRAGLAERDVTDTWSERAGLRVEGTTSLAEGMVEVIVERGRP